MYKEILKLNKKKTSSFYNEPKLSQRDHQRSGRWQMSTHSDAPSTSDIIQEMGRKTGSTAHLLEQSELGPPRLPKAGGNSLAVSYKTKYNLAIRSHSHTPCDFFTKQSENMPTQNMYTVVWSLIHSCQNQKQSRCLSVSEWISWNIRVESQSALNRSC